MEMRVMFLQKKEATEGGGGGGEGKKENERMKREKTYTHENDGKLTIVFVRFS